MIHYQSHTDTNLRNLTLRTMVNSAKQIVIYYKWKLQLCVKSALQKLILAKRI